MPFLSLMREFVNTRELKALFLSLFIAVGAISLSSLLVMFLDLGLKQTGSQFLAADRQLQSSRMIPEHWKSIARSNDLTIAETVEFASMAFSDTSMQLVSVKAVDHGYPLKGQLMIRKRSGEPIQYVRNGPQVGQAWISQRLAGLLNVEEGSLIGIGDLSLSVDGILEQEPDASFSFSTMAPRVVMNMEDLSRANVLSDGSRYTHRLLLAGSEENLKKYHLWVKPQMVSSQRWLGLEEERPAISNAIAKSQQYLSLGSALVVLLSTVALALSSRQFSASQLQTIAILKTLGMSRMSIVRRYLFKLLVIALLAAMGGSLVGGGLFIAAKPVVNDLLGNIQGDFSALSWLPIVLISALFSLFVIVLFTLPTLFDVSRISPMAILRSAEYRSKSTFLIQLVTVSAVTFVYLYFFGCDLKLILSLFVGVLVCVVVLYAFTSFFFIWLSRIIGDKPSSLANGLRRLIRKKGGGIWPITVLSLALMFMGVVFLIKTSLLNEWQAQLPEDTPNHFLINIKEAQVSSVENRLNNHGINTSSIYPIVRGRLTHINGIEVHETVSKEEQVNAINRELNLTWATSLPEGNKVIKGQWLGDKPTRGEAFRWVSVEEKLANRLKIHVGDSLTFSVADQGFKASVSDIRSVDWESMKPNFYMVFNPDSLDSFKPVYLTSLYLPESKTEVMTELARTFPTITILEVSQFIERIRSIVQKVAEVIELIMYLVLCASIVVVYAISQSGFATRAHEIAALRAYGATRRFVVGSQWAEFIVSGFLAGLVATIAVECGVGLIHRLVFNIDPVLHLNYWWGLPVMGLTFMVVTNHWQVSKTLSQSPMIILRASQ